MTYRVFCAVLFLISFFSCKDKEGSTDIPKMEIPEEILFDIQKKSFFQVDSTMAESISDSLVRFFYETNNYKTYWNAPENRNTLLKALESVEEDGLFKADFDVDTLQKLENQIGILSKKEHIRFDFLLTENLLRYLKKIGVGSVSPKTLYEDWDLPENTIDFSTAFTQLKDKNNLKHVLEAAKPNHIVYRRLKKALQLLKTYPEVAYPVLPVDTKIEPNDTSELVTKIKERLLFWKDMPPTDSLTPVYDHTMLLGVQRFQIRHGLAPDGIIGKGTLLALNTSPKKRKEQIIANLERWRWYPKNLGKEHIIINIPDYSLHLIYEGDTIRTHRVIVGTLSRKTPVLTSKLSHLVFNPTWTIPPTIKRKDIIPAIKADTSYLKSKKITMYDKEGNKVAPEDWEEDKALGYRYVQSPGTYNSLGLVKFMFPNDYLVYLHDTNSRTFFEKANRSLSSGCVRVEDPFELAAYLLNDNEKWNLEKINELLKTNKTKDVFLKRDVYIHLLYWTAWSEKETLHFREDLYGKDAMLYEQLRN